MAALRGEVTEGYQRLLLPRAPAELKRALERGSRRRIELTLTANLRSMLRAVPQVSGRLSVRAHHVFLFAPDSIVAALARFIKNPLDRPASRAVDFFIVGEAERMVSAKGLRSRRRAAPRRRTRGRYFDLQEVFDRLNARDFEGMVKAHITWGTERRGRSRSIRFGSYTSAESGAPGLIRIHPALDRSFVVPEFVDFVVFHEMLHALIPVRYEHGRRVLHPPEFKERERRFPDYDFAASWERRNLHRFLDGDQSEGPSLE